ncbi:DUF262 domain-containing protein [Labilibacter marinus]|uniref:DUF262 domain-containing protein n=1 Tax=Labilibacter marinus TaxID=1477105 RepID=UPI00117B9282|nr:DUF262 domain-containing protein [Labilibacter marinus]
MMDNFFENQEIEEQEVKKWEEEDNSIPEDNSDNHKLKSLRVIKSNQDYNLDYLANSIDKNIQLGPDYQRRSRWSAIQKSRLIESFLMNIPIPPIFLYENDYYEYEVVDGRQRLEAINDFFKDRFKLKGLEFLTHLDGEKFSTLEDENKRLLYRRTITATILLVESNSFDKYDLRMILFNRLNTGGEKLNFQELRNAIYSSRFNDLIFKLSTNQFFRSFWSIPENIEKIKNNPLYRNMSDCELVLRFFAIKEAYYGEVEGSMKKLLDDTMKKYKSANDDELEKFGLDFSSSIQGLFSNIGIESIMNSTLEKPRRARNLYDSMLVAYSITEEDKIQPKETVLNNLKIVLGKPEEYDKIITKGNSIENIKYRVNKAIEILTTTI